MSGHNSSTPPDSTPGLEKPADTQSASGEIQQVSDVDRVWPAACPVTRTYSLKRRASDVTEEELHAARKRVRKASRRNGWTTELDLKLHYAAYGMAEFRALGEQMALFRAREASGYVRNSEMVIDSGEETQDAGNSDASEDSDEEQSRPKAPRATPEQDDTSVCLSGGESAVSEQNNFDAGPVEAECEMQQAADHAPESGEYLPFPADIAYSQGFRRPVLWRNDAAAVSFLPEYYQ